MKRTSHVNIADTNRDVGWTSMVIMLKAISSLLRTISLTRPCTAMKSSGGGSAYRVRSFVPIVQSVSDSDP